MDAPRRSLRVPGLIAATALTLGLAGCGGGGSFTAPDSVKPFPTGAPSPSGPTVLTQDQADAALVTTADVGGLTPVGRKQASMSPLCVTGGVDRRGASTTAFAQFGGGGGGYGQQLFSFSTAAGATSAFDAVARQVTGCHVITTTLGPGVTASLKVRSNREVTGDGVDQQVNYAATGTYSAPSAGGLGTTRTPVFIFAAISRVNNNLTTLFSYSLGSSDGGGTSQTQATQSLSSLNDRMLNRLRATVIRAAQDG